MRPIKKQITEYRIDLSPADIQEAVADFVRKKCPYLDKAKVTEFGVNTSKNVVKGGTMVLRSHDQSEPVPATTTS